MSKIDLHLSKIWNDSLIKTDRPFKERSYAYASELDKPLIDRYLSMKGIIPTNPPNDRARRKFFSGNMTEFIVGIVLNQMGIIKNCQQTIEITDGAIPVRGRLDFLVGGKPDYNKARDYMSKLPFEKEMMDRFMKVIELFEIKYNDVIFNDMVMEIKSCSHFVLEMLQEGGRIVGHELQTFHYLKGLNLPHGHINYLSKDDLLMFEVDVELSNRRLEASYYGNLAELNHYLTANEPPPPPPSIIWEKKFKKNIFIEYSAYLKLVYGFDQPQDYADSVKGKIASWNRLLKRLRQINLGETTPGGKAITLTDKNKIAIEDMNNNGWNPGELVKDLSTIEEDDE